MSWHARLETPATASTSIGKTTSTCTAEHTGIILHLYLKCRNNTFRAQQHGWDFACYISSTDSQQDCPVHNVPGRGRIVACSATGINGTSNSWTCSSSSSEHVLHTDSEPGLWRKIVQAPIVLESLHHYRIVHDLGRLTRHYLIILRASSAVSYSLCCCILTGMIQQMRTYIYGCLLVSRTRDIN